MAKFNNPTKVITGVNTRWSYVNAWEPKSINGGAPKYSVSLIIPKSDTKTLEKIRAAIQAAYEEGQSKLKGNGRSVPALSALKTPHGAGNRGCGQEPDPGTFRGVFRGVRQGEHQFLCFQQQREQRDCLRPEQSAEDPGRRAPWRQEQGGG